MGGFGSGIWRDRGARRCEQMHRIDLADMRRRGLLTPDRTGSLHWSCGGQPSGSIRFNVLPHALHLSYRTRSDGDEEWTSVEEYVPFTWTEAAVGGRRRWLVCLSCGRRCRILYGGDYFRCRRCYGLTYTSQYRPHWERAISRARDVRTRLGGSGAIDEEFPPKPRGMHWRTYRRLEAVDEDAGNAWVVEVMGTLGIRL